MRSRGLVVVLALILATLATVGVFLYSRGVKQNAIEGGDLKAVVVSKVNIPANTDLNQLIREGQFTTVSVPTDAVIKDAVTQISQLQDQRNSVFIFANEQIPVARVRGNQVPGGLLSIPEGYQAITVALDAPAAVSGALTGGDNVTLYATFDDVKLTAFNEKTLKNLIKAASKPSTSATNTGNNASSGNGNELPTFDTTVVLTPSVEVLRVIRPTTQNSFGGGSSTNQDSTATLQVILALKPEDAQKFVFSLEEGKVYLSLLPPNQDGEQLDPLTVGQILLPDLAAAKGK
jgi:Flp pilus assembly protein CpaB